MDPDPEPLGSRFRISSTAWWIGLTSIVLAVIVIKATPGSPVSGCFHSKHCFPLPRAPLLYGTAVLVLGSFLSTLVGRIPRHWVVGWSLTLAGLASAVLAGIPVLEWVLLSSGEHYLYVSLLGQAFVMVMVISLSFVGLAVVLLAGALLASALAGTPSDEPISTVAEPDPRPRWKQEIEAVRAALLASSQPTLASDESLLVAELAYELRNKTLAVPEPLEATSSQLLDLLSRTERESHTRGLVLDLLTRAAAFEDGRSSPYRCA